MSRESEVPIELKHALDDAPSEMSLTKPVEIFPRDQWPDCPDCGVQLDLSSITTDSTEAVLAAVMLCRNHDETARVYVYEDSTGNVYFDHAPGVGTNEIADER